MKSIFWRVLGWSLGSCGCALYACMETQFRRPAISKNKSSASKIRSRSHTPLSLSCPIFRSLSKNLSEIKKLLLFDDADGDLKDC